MNVPITFPPILPGDLSGEPIIVETEIEGYLMESVCGRGGVVGNNVRILFQELEFIHQSPLKRNPYSFGWFLRRNHKVEWKNKDASILQRWRVGQKYNHGVHGRSVIFTLKHHIGSFRIKGVEIHTVHHSFYNEISHSKRSSNLGHRVNHYIRMPKAKE